jgi:hypothetical protein
MIGKESRLSNATINVEVLQSTIMFVMTADPVVKVIIVIMEQIATIVVLDHLVPGIEIVYMCLMNMLLRMTRMTLTGILLI